MDLTVDQANEMRPDGGHSPSAVSIAKEAAAQPPPPPASSSAPSDLQQSPPKSQLHPSDPPPASTKSVSWSDDLKREAPTPAAGDGGATTAMSPQNNPYVTHSSAPSSSSSAKNNTMETVKTVLSRWGKKVGESAKKAGDLSRNTWQHLKTGPSFAEAAMGRIAQGTKLIAEGGYENIFCQTFETLPEEQLKKCYTCYLSTSAGPVMGILYLSSAKLAFCSDNPLSYKVGDQTEWSYYKVVIPLHQLRAANPSVSRTNSSEKYIQVVSVDNQEFWFMGFVNYDGAVKHLREILHKVHE